MGKTTTLRPSTAGQNVGKRISGKPISTSMPSAIGKAKNKYMADRGIDNILVAREENEERYRRSLPPGVLQQRIREEDVAEIRRKRKRGDVIKYGFGREVERVKPEDAAVRLAKAWGLTN